MKPITNEQRAEWARLGLLNYATGKEGGAELYDDTETVLSDFLCDLMHHAERQGIDFATCAARAEGHYDAERREEADATLIDSAPKMLLALERAAKIFRDCIHEDHPVAIEIDTIIAQAKGETT